VIFYPDGYPTAYFNPIPLPILIFRF